MKDKAKNLCRCVGVIAMCFFVTHVFAQVPVKSVTLQDMKIALEKHSATVIDIREPQEHATGVAQGTILMPMRSIAARLSELPKPGQGELLVVCNTQNRSARIVEQLVAAGYNNAKYVHGGMSLWAKQGLPMVKPK